MLQPGQRRGQVSSPRTDGHKSAKIRAPRVKARASRNNERANNMRTTMLWLILALVGVSLQAQNPGMQAAQQATQQASQQASQQAIQQSQMASQQASQAMETAQQQA